MILTLALLTTVAACGSTESTDEDTEALPTSDDPNVVILSAKAVERSGIELSKVEPGVLSEVIEAPAEIHFIPSKTAHITPLVSGNISDVHVKRGQKVKAGEVLAELSSMDLGEARARLTKAKAEVEVASSNAERQKQLAEEGIAAKRRQLEAEGTLRQAKAEYSAAQAYLSVFRTSGGAGAHMPLKSPIDGVVTAVHAVQGENVAADTKLFVVTDTSHVWAVGQVSEQDVAKVEVGLPAELELRAYRGKRWSGKVGFVPCELEESSRSLKIRVELENSSGKLRRGLFGTLFVKAGLGDEAPTSDLDAGTSVDGGSSADGGTLPASSTVVSVPLGAVQKVGDRRVVFVEGDEENSFRAQSVKTGREADGRIEITEGLSRDARVVTKGAFTLKSQLLRSELGEE